MHLSISSRNPCVEDVTFAGRRILVVEDNFLVPLATTDLLESVGCVIVGPAAGLATALQLARSEPLDAAVLDIDLAGEAVWPVAEELQRRNVPFLFLSSRRQQREPSQPFAAAQYAEKPLERDRVLHALDILWKH